MANFMSSGTGNSWVLATVGRVVLWVLVLSVLTQKVLPIVPYSWNLISTSFFSVCALIKQRPFIYVIINFIIISILICSSSFTQKLNNLLQKLQRTSSHNISSLISQTSRKLSLSWEDDSWWHKMVNSEETEHYPPPVEERETVPFPPRGVEKQPEVKGEEVGDEGECGDYDEFVVERKGEELVEEGGDNDTLEDTWKAIMEAKKNGGPYLKKSGTWTSGDRGGGGVVEKKGFGRLAKCKAELKKWRTFSREVVQETEYRGGGYGGGGGRRKKTEVALTYHDELKKRSDAFIARFNNDIRLQRLESDQRLSEITNRGL